ncbi:CBU_2016 family Dot/Icm T4SS effector [Coxiella burnetii]|uniref:CBU_2016 family Dot/Icm T4SS effector n=1 Tax=Coxiella burnetii TaxID=777 RepID=UPI002230C1EA|nr:CBU_2016 family Dot/Icm T4SS effector [Coxiella burnetii]
MVVMLEDEKKEVILAIQKIEEIQDCLLHGLSDYDNYGTFLSSAEMQRLRTELLSMPDEVKLTEAFSDCFNLIVRIYDSVHFFTDEEKDEEVLERLLKFHTELELIEISLEEFIEDERALEDFKRRADACWCEFVSIPSVVKTRSGRTIFQEAASFKAQIDEAYETQLLDREQLIRERAEPFYCDEKFEDEPQSSGFDP